METADKTDEQTGDEQPGPSKSGPPPASAGEGRDASPPPPHSGSGESQSGTLNLYATLGLSPEDVDALAQIPEKEISIETLPRLIMQLKAKRAKSGGRPAAAAASASTPAKEEKEKEKEHKEARDDREQEDWDADYADSAPSRRSASKTPTSRDDDDDDESHGKSESHERPWHARSKRETRHYKSSFEGSPPKFPMSYTMDDLRGTMPKSFPHTCSLCLCTLYSAAPWNDHVNGFRHEENRREFLRKNHESSSKAPDSHSGGGDGHPVKKDHSSSSSLKRIYNQDKPGEWNVRPTYRQRRLKPKPGTKVVVTKFVRGTVAVEDLLSLAKPFGTVVKHLIFPCKGFLEFSTHEEAVDMVSHFASEPAYVKENKLALYLSPVVGSIQTPKLDRVEKRTKRSIHGVVCFSNLPSDKETESEILDVAKMFGEVRYSKVVDDVVLIKMEDWNDAEIMEKYYYSNPLKIFGKTVKVRISSSYKQMRLSPEPSRRGDSSRSSSSVVPKIKEATKSSNLKNKDKASSQKDSTEKKTSGRDDQRPADEHERMDVSLNSGGEEDEEGMKIEDEPATSEEEPGQGDDAIDEQTPEEPEAPVAGASPEKDSEEGPETDPNSEETVVPAERPPADLREGPDKASDPLALAEEPTSAENPEDKSGDTEDMLQEDNDDDEEDMDFPENMEDFVTLDELDNDAGEKLDHEESPKGGKVVTVRHIRKGYGVENELLKLAKPFGKVTNHAISFYQQEAMLEMESNEAANRMIKYYQGSKKALIFGRPVSVSMSLVLQELEAPSGKSIYIGNLPRQKYSDISLLRLAQPFGKISAYHLNWHHRKCYIQMDCVEAADKMVQRYLHRPPKFYGSVLRICLCRKGDSQIPWKSPVKYEQWCAQQKDRAAQRDREEVEAEGDTDTEEEAEPETENGQSAASPVRKMSATEDGALSTVSESDAAASASAGTGDKEKAELKPGRAPPPLGPYLPNNPIGIDYIVQRTGFFCKLCKVFYTNEKTAKSLHCSSLAHYQKLKVKLAEDPSE